MSHKKYNLTEDQLDFSGFKAYDIRGKIGKEITEDFCYYIAKALTKHLNAKKVCVGNDNRLSSQSFKNALIQGFVDLGVEVIDLGQTGTEEVYFGTSFYNCDGGVQVTASHNPKDYNGLKIVGKGSVPIGLDTGLRDIQKIIEEDIVNQNSEISSNVLGTVKHIDHRNDYFKKLQTFFNIKKLQSGRKLKVVLNVGNGTAGSLLRYITDRLKAENVNIDFVFLYEESDGNFPNGIPNPLLVENRKVTSDAVIAHKADLGVAFDGDFDRCFFFDEHGNFLEGYYVCGLMSESFLRMSPRATICYEPRLLWNTKSIIESNGGEAILTKSGHAFIKTSMRKHNALYGGEMSAHHYFRDFYFCDSGMIPWLMIIELLQSSNKPMSEYIATYKNNYPCSDEINFTITSKEVVFNAISEFYKDQNKEILTLDGLSYDFGNWRFNVRGSNTEPLLRLNIETRADKALLEEKILELTNIIETTK